MISEAQIQIGRANFQQEVVEADQPVLVDFFANWCAPCRQIAPVVRHLATQYAGRLKVVAVDVDQNGFLVDRFDVQRLPCLILFKGGRPIPLQTGYSPTMLPAICERIELLLR